MVSHFEMEGPLRYRQLRNYANRRIYVFDTLGIDLTLRGIPQRRLSIAFSPSKVFGHWRRQNFGERSSTSNKERTAANTNAASAYCFEILCERNFSKGYWRFIWCWRICYMYYNSQSFKGYCETKSTIPAIPRKPGWYKEKVLWCCALSSCDRGHRLYASGS